MKKFMILISSLLIFNINAVNAEEIISNEEDNTTISEVKYVAKVNDKNYETLEEAISNAEYNDVITLLEDTAGSFKITKGITIDLNKHSINGDNKNSIFDIDLEDGILEIKNGTLGNNTISLDGGSVIIKNGSLKIDNVKFENNNAKNGGAIKVSGGQIEISNCTFNNNKATTGSGGAIQVAADYNNSVVEISNSKFNKNSSKGNGGAISVSSNNKNNNANLVINNGNTFDSNEAGIYGGAIHTSGSNTSFQVDGSKFINNKANAGGAIYNIKNTLDEKVVFNNSTFIGNEAKTIAGAIYSRTTKNEIVEINGCTIKNNKANLGGGIYLDSTNAGSMNVTIDSIIYDNSAKNAADDIYTSNRGNITITLPNVTNYDNAKLNCDDIIDGWYIDIKGSRWNAHGEEVNVNKVNEITLTGSNSLKAAHDGFGKVLVKYVDKDGKSLSEDITLNGKYNTEYVTEEKEFQYYELVDVKGNKTGKFSNELNEVTYIYEYVGGTGGDDPEFPKTGIEDNNIIEIIGIVSLLSLGTVVVLKKKLI